MSSMAGPLLILVFSLSQAVRDVLFSGLFQGLGFFFVLACIFSLSSVGFLAVAAVVVPAELRGIWRHGREVLWMNLTTALAWSCYFFALKHVEPSVVNTIHSGMGPLTVVALGLLGSDWGGRARNRLEAASYVGIALSIVFLFAIVLTGRSGLAAGNVGDSALGLSLLFVSGASITMSLMISKRLHDKGFGSLSVTAVRYVAAVAVSLAFTVGMGQGDGRSLGDVATISTSGFVLVALPTFILQMGIARTGALTAQIIRALGPVFVFVLEQFGSRIAWSWPVLVAIVFYSVCATTGNLARGYGFASKPSP